MKNLIKSVGVLCVEIIILLLLGWCTEKSGVIIFPLEHLSKLYPEMAAIAKGVCSVNAIGAPIAFFMLMKKIIYDGLIKETGVNHMCFWAQLMFLFFLCLGILLSIEDSAGYYLKFGKELHDPMVPVVSLTIIIIISSWVFGTLEAEEKKQRI